ncbi:sigma-54-dependent transcriptional regulator [Terriglobus sp. RCC_193]|uniref:sigma-54-dependent transcriptional regulator n=1 Tax=Terriglobus sp. RCC_193 TaxID=3239218 RepID=UPI0035246255
MPVSRGPAPDLSHSHHVARWSFSSPLAPLPEGADIPQLSLSDRKLELLVVDDDLPVLKACCEVAAGMGFAVHAANTSEQAREVIRIHAIDVVLMDLRMPGGGLSLLEDVRRVRPRTSVVIMTAFATVSSAVEAMRMGATDYLTKPFAMDELTSVLERAGQRRTFEIEGQRVQGSLRAQAGFGNLVGRSPEMEKLYRIISKVATANHPVLILGESGSGKETVARAIHASGPLATRGFHVLECGQLAPAVLESELFGFTRGAYTGFDRSQVPLLASPEGGTVFLDGISEMPLELQARLMRVLQDRQITPPGAPQAMPLTARVLAGSSRDLAALVAQGQFRKDLYYRLNVVSLRIPALRERREDIPLLLEYFLVRMRRERATTYRFSPEAMEILTSYDWPGNVRELESAIERACALSSGPVLYMGDLPTQMHQKMSTDTAAALTRVDERPSQPSVPAADRPSNPIVSIAELEREAILHTIRQLHGDKLMAAKLLGIGKTTLYRKLKEYGISDI